MIIISDVRDTVWLSKGKFNTPLLDAYRKADEKGIKIYLFSNDGLHEYQGSGKDEVSNRKDLNEIINKSFTQKTVFLSSGGAVLIGEDNAEVAADSKMPRYLSKNLSESFEAIKDYLKEENDFVFVDNDKDFFPAATKAGFKTFNSLAETTPAELIDYIASKTESVVDAKLSSVIINRDEITQSDRSHNWHRYFLIPFLKRNPT